MTVNTPKDPIEGVTEWTNEETGIKYRYVGGAWRAVSSKAAQDVADALGQLDLEKVLTNGNVADKDIYLTHIESSDSDVIDISPEKAKVVVATEGDKVPTFELQHYAVDNNSQVKLKLDEDGTRFDIECDEKVNNIHFRFEEEDKLILNKEGDAVFGGKVKVEPGTAGNEAVTYSQLIEIEEELESIVPSIERGQFDLLLRDIVGGDEGYFNMLRHFNNADKKAEEAKCKEEYDTCQRNPNLDAIDCEADFTRCQTRIPQVGTGYHPTDEFADVIRLKFSYYSVDGTTHDWSSLKPGQLIDVFNIEDDSYMLAEVTGTQGMWYEGVDIDVKVLQFKGKATGRCRIKVFELDLNAGSDVDFVRKSGDKMTGKLETTDRIWIRPNGKGAAGANNMLVVNQEEADTGSIARFQKNNVDLVKVQYDGTLSVENNRIVKVMDPTDDTDGANKHYVDSNFVSKAGDTMTGALLVEPESGGTTLRIQGSPTSSDASNILNVYSNKGSQLFWVDSKNAGLTGTAKTPTNGSHLVTKKYVDDRRGWGVPYKYRTEDQKAENLQPGEFFIANNNSIYCHRYDANSKDMATSSSYVTDQNKFGLMKVYAANGNLLHMIEFKELRIGQGSNHYCRWLYTSKLKSYSSWMASETYYLADGLLFPY